MVGHDFKIAICSPDSKRTNCWGARGRARHRILCPGCHLRLASQLWREAPSAPCTWRVAPSRRAIGLPAYREIRSHLTTLRFGAQRLHFARSAFTWRAAPPQAPGDARGVQNKLRSGVVVDRCRKSGAFRRRSRNAAGLGMATGVIFRIAPRSAISRHAVSQCPVSSACTAEPGT